MYSTQVLESSIYVFKIFFLSWIFHLVFTCFVINIMGDYLLEKKEYSIKMGI